FAVPLYLRHQGDPRSCDGFGTSDPRPGGLAVNAATFQSGAPTSLETANMTDDAGKSEPVATGDAAHTVKRLPDVPVFNCHVYASQADTAGLLHARVSNLPEVVAEGRTQR